MGFTVEDRHLIKCLCQQGLWNDKFVQDVFGQWTDN